MPGVAHIGLFMLASPDDDALRHSVLGLAASTAIAVTLLNRRRLGLAIVLLILVPVATAVAALIALAVAVVLMWATIAFEHRGYGEGRSQLRHEAAVGHA